MLCLPLAVNLQICNEPKSLSIIKVDSSDPYKMGFEIGKKFAPLIRSRVSRDPLLHSQMLPFATTDSGQHLIQALSESNKCHYPRYWFELEGLAAGSCVSLLEILLLNFRKEVTPFLPMNDKTHVANAEDCSDVLMCGSVAAVGHNEDAHVSVKDHAFLVQGSLPTGALFTAYTYAGELPSCAFGFNTHGVGFTLNSVPLSTHEVVAGGIGRNFVSRDLLEACSLDDALKSIQVKELSVGHSYNVFDVNLRNIINVETASRGRCSKMEIGEVPFFHANMYRHLDVSQTQDPSSLHRQAKAATHVVSTKEDILNVLGDTEDQDYPIYMQGPNLCTLCTVLVNIDKKEVTIYHGNPRDGRVEASWLLS